MGAGFRRRKSTIPSPSACWACASARPCWAGKSACAAKTARARPSASAFRGRRPGPTKQTGMRILLTDDHAVVRQGLKLILADHFKRAVFGEARNAQEAFARI